MNPVVPCLQIAKLLLGELLTDQKAADWRTADRLKTAVGGTAAGGNTALPGRKIGSLQKIEKSREKKMNREIKRDNYAFYALA